MKEEPHVSAAPCAPLTNKHISCPSLQDLMDPREMCFLGHKQTMSRPGSREPKAKPKTSISQSFGELDLGNYCLFLVVPLFAGGF